MLRPPIATSATRVDSRRSGATTARNSPWTRSGCASRSGRGHRERHLSQGRSTSCRRHHDPHILPEPREKHEELLGGESVGIPAEEPGEAFGCGISSRSASCVPLSPRATDRSWICLASLAFESSSSGDASPMSRKTFPEPPVNPTSSCARFVIAFSLQPSPRANAGSRQAPITVLSRQAGPASPHTQAGIQPPR